MEPHPDWTLNTSLLHGQFADNDEGNDYKGHYNTSVFKFKREKITIQKTVCMRAAIAERAVLVNAFYETYVSQRYNKLIKMHILYLT